MICCQLFLHCDLGIHLLFLYIYQVPIHSTSSIGLLLCSQ
nr:MAG TPA: hypothetical protein [Bacteriophage sp.]